MLKSIFQNIQEESEILPLNHKKKISYQGKRLSVLPIIYEGIGPVWRSVISLILLLLLSSWSQITYAKSRKAVQSNNVSLLGSLNTGDGNGLFVEGDYAYLANGDYGLWIINITNPSDPKVVGKYNTGDSAYYVYVDGKYAYVADRGDGLRIIDVSNPKSPQEVGHYNKTSQVYWVSVKGNYAYVANHDYGLVVLDISDPTKPKEVGHLDTNGKTLRLFILNNYAYLADESDGLRVIDISNPDNPKEVGFHDTNDDAQGVYVQGGYAYVADRNDGLRVFDVSNPTNPQEVGHYDTGGTAMNVYVSGNYAYVSDGYGGVKILDISNPKQPQKVGYYSTGNQVRGLFVLGNYIYGGFHYGGFYILKNDLIGSGSSNSVNNLLAYYPLNGNVIDSSGHNYNGKNYNVTPTTDRHGKVDSAMHFNGKNAWISLEQVPPSAFTVYAFTLSYWFRTDFKGDQTILQTSDGKAAGQALLGASTINQQTLGVVYRRGNNGPKVELFKNIDLTDNKWHNITIVRDTAKHVGELYIDGQLSLTKDDNFSSLPITPQSYFRFGYGTYSLQNYTSYFSGDMDDIRLYNYALSDSQVKALYDNNSGGNTGNNSIKGIVSDLNEINGDIHNQPLSNTQVSLYNGSSKIGQLQTDSTGTFQFNDLSEGTYSIVLSHSFTNNLSNQNLKWSFSRTTSQDPFNLTMPYSLFERNDTLISKLSNLKNKNGILLNIFGYNNLFLKSYDTNSLNGLINSWETTSKESEYNSIDSTIIRTYIANYLMIHEFTNASNSTFQACNALANIIAEFFVTDQFFKKINANIALRKAQGTLGKFSASIMQTLINKMDFLLNETLIKLPVNFISSALPNPYNNEIPQALDVTLKTVDQVIYDDKSFQSSILKNAGTAVLKDLSSTLASNYILGEYYVNTTQKNLDELTTNSQNYSISSNSLDAYRKVVKGKNSPSYIDFYTKKTDKIVQDSKDLSKAGDLANTMSNVTKYAAKALAVSGVGTSWGGILYGLSYALKGASIVSYLGAVTFPAIRTYQITQEIPQGISLTYHPDQPLQKVVPEESPIRHIAYSNANLNHYKDVLETSVISYNQVLNQIISLIKQGDKQSAINLFSKLLDVDNDLSKNLLISQSPIYATANQIYQSDSTFQHQYGVLANDNYHNNIYRIALYARLLTYATDSTSSQNNVISIADSVQQQLKTTSETINNVTQRVSTTPAPPFLIVSQDSFSDSTITYGNTFTLTAAINNTGTSTARKILVTMQADSATDILTSKSITIDSLQAGKTDSVSWKMVVSDTTKVSFNYLIKLKSENARVLSSNGTFSVTDRNTETGINGIGNQQPSHYNLAQNYPNPFNPTTNIRYTLPASQHVTIEVYNTLGQLVAKLIDKYQAAGSYTIHFDAHELPSGMYIYRLKAGNFTETKKMMLIK